VVGPRLYGNVPTRLGLRTRLNSTIECHERITLQALQCPNCLAGPSSTMNTAGCRRGREL
jgi:hypothetical protein